MIKRIVSGILHGLGVKKRPAHPHASSQHPPHPARAHHVAPEAAPPTAAPRPAAERPAPHRHAGERSAAGHSSSGRPSGDRRRPPRTRRDGPEGPPRPHPHPRSHAVPPRAPVPPAPPAIDNWQPDRFQVPPETGKTRFHDLGLPLPLLHAVADLGFKYCTPIQALSLPPALTGADVAGRAQTGTGKTAAFLLTMFNRFLANPLPPTADGRRVTRALILAPTRELVVQITKDAGQLGRHCPFRTVAVYGGHDFEAQKDTLTRQGADVIAATPGRLIDFLRRQVVDLSRIEVLVLDEADRMLDMGFIPDVRRILAKLPPREKRQTMLFSATLSHDIMNLARQWMRDPTVLEAEPEQVAGADIEQLVYLVSSRDKLPLLVKLLENPAMDRVLVFANRRDQAQTLTDRLERRRINCALLSGDVPQNKRLKILEAFRDGTVRVLVATDVAGRGLHIEKISHVVNFDVPLEAEDYVHRIGRTGRAGAIGTALTFACEMESFTLPEIEKLLGEPLRYLHADDLLGPPPNRTKPA